MYAKANNWYKINSLNNKTYHYLILYQIFKTTKDLTYTN